MIPSYLKNIGKEIKSNKDFTKIKIICTCGCEDFKLYKKRKSEEEINREKEYENQIAKEFGGRFERQSDANGKVFMVKRNIFGKITKKVEFKELNIPVFKNFISVKCGCCGKEYVLFDENIHGYDSIASAQKPYENIESIEYLDALQKIEVDVYYNEDNEEDLEDVSVAFGRIKIIKISNGKRITCCDFECE